VEQSVTSLVNSEFFCWNILRQMIQPKLSHSWDLEEHDALLLQRELSQQVTVVDHFDEIKLVAGVDVAYDDRSNCLFAAAVVLETGNLDVVETASGQDIATFPYIPGLFSFRELPPLIKVLEQLSCTPDLIICDGQGIAHPRRFGLACHLGVLYDIPTIGCSKTRLMGQFNDLGTQRGDSTPLADQGEIIGCVLRTQDNVKPLYVSIGHRVSLETACNWVLRLASQYRLPETTRLADQSVRALMKKAHAEFS
jgi:deoxyribonuclease V